VRAPGPCKTLNPPREHAPATGRSPASGARAHTSASGAQARRRSSHTALRQGKRHTRKVSEKCGAAPLCAAEHWQSLGRLHRVTNRPPLCAPSSQHRAAAGRSWHIWAFGRVRAGSHAAAHQPQIHMPRATQRCTERTDDAHKLPSRQSLAADTWRRKYCVCCVGLSDENTLPPLALVTLLLLLRHLLVARGDLMLELELVGRALHLFQLSLECGHRRGHRILVLLHGG